MLLKDVKTKYEEHRIIEYNIQRNKVLFINREMKPVYGNIYIGKEKDLYDTKICKVYVYYKEHDIGFCIFERENTNTSVIDVIEMINRLQMRTAKDFLIHIDRSIFTLDEVNTFYLAVAIIIEPSREKIYREILRYRDELLSKHIRENKVMIKTNYTVVKNECDKINNMIDFLKNGGEIVNDILVTDMFDSRYETFFGMLAGRYYPSLPDKLYRDFDSFLESATIKDNAVTDIKTSKKKRIMINAIETIIRKVQEEDLKAILCKGNIMLKSQKEDTYEH